MGFGGHVQSWRRRHFLGVFMNAVNYIYSLGYLTAEAMAVTVRHLVPGQIIVVFRNKESSFADSDLTSFLIITVVAVETVGVGKALFVNYWRHCMCADTTWALIGTVWNNEVWLFSFVACSILLHLSVHLVFLTVFKNFEIHHYNWKYMARFLCLESTVLVELI